MHYKYLCLQLILILFTIFGCEKSELSYEKKKELLTSGSWKIIEVEKHILPDDNADDITVTKYDEEPFSRLAFNADGSVTYYDRKRFNKDFQGSWDIVDNHIRTDLQAAVPSQGQGGYYPHRLFYNDRIIELTNESLILKSSVKVDRGTWTDPFEITEYYEIVTFARE